jgi:hypothetical protein
MMGEWMYRFDNLVATRGPENRTGGQPHLSVSDSSTALWKCALCGKRSPLSRVHCAYCGMRITDDAHAAALQGTPISLSASCTPELVALPDGGPPLLRTGPGGDYTRDHAAGNDLDEGLTSFDIAFIVLFFALLLLIAALG